MRLVTAATPTPGIKRFKTEYQPCTKGATTKVPKRVNLPVRAQSYGPPRSMAVWHKKSPPPAISPLEILLVNSGCVSSLEEYQAIQLDDRDDADDEVDFDRRGTVAPIAAELRCQRCIFITAPTRMIILRMSFEARQKQTAMQSRRELVAAPKQDAASGFLTAHKITAALLLYVVSSHIAIIFLFSGLVHIHTT